MAIPTPPAAPLEPYVLADDPVLDMLNTLANIDGMPWDFWQTDADVQRWLVRLEWVQPAAMPAFEEGALLAAARELREVVRDLVATRKLGQVGNPTALNSFFAQGSQPSTAGLAGVRGAAVGASTQIADGRAIFVADCRSCS